MGNLPSKGVMRVLLLLLAALTACPAAAAIREVRADERVVVPQGSGLLLVAVDSERALQSVSIRRSDALLGSETLRALPAGTTKRLYLVPAGSYRWTNVREGGTRYQMSDDDEYSFTVSAGVVNYPGHLVYRSLDERRVLAHVANRGLLAMDWLRQTHAQLARDHAFEYRGHYPDPFPAFYREHGAPAAGPVTPPGPLPAPGPLPLPVDVLWKPIELELVGLNPGGDIVATVERSKRDDETRWILRLIDLRGEESRLVLESPVEITRIHWSGDRTLVVSCRESGQLDTLFVLHIRGEVGQWAIERLRFPYKGRLVDPLEGDPGHVLFASVYLDNVAAGVQVHKVPISDQRSLDRFRFSRKTALGRSVREGREWFTDGSGELRAAIAYRDDHHVLLHGRDGEFREVMVLDEAGAFTPLGLSADGNLVYGASDKDREQRDLVEFDPGTGRITRTVFSRPRVDVQSALFDPSHALIGVTYYEEGLLVSEYFDEAGRMMQERLQRAFPGKTVRILDRDAASRQVLLLVGGSDQPSEVYHLDAAAGTAALLLQMQPWLEGHAFRPSTVVRATAADGFPIEAYLTLPEAGAPPPLVVLAHGGPIGIRDTRYFDPEVQFLASLGYAVLQVNFRGSEGYGREFREAGRRSYGSLIEDDIDAALSVVLAGNKIDRERMCAMGSSYGGYSSLVSAIRWPGRFRCVVSIAGVSDRILFFTASDTGRSKEGRKLLEEAIGDPRTATDEMLEFSPLYRYREIDVPVLLAHGTEDLRVDFEHSRRLSRMLSEAGRPPTLLALEGEGHSFEDEANVKALWEAVAGFLRAHLDPPRGGRAAAPASMD